jgi:sialic acid synthase SpsE
MQKPYIIAEMAWGYTGSYEKSLQILKGASESGADAIGIHLTDLPNYMVEDYRCTAGQTLSDSADTSISIYEFLTKTNMPNDDWLKFDKEAQKLNIDLVVMCNDTPSFHFSKKIKVKKYVIPAAIFLELDLIRLMVEENNDIILRAGGATLSEIEAVLEFIYTIDSNAKINVLVGIQLYPTPIEELHISSIDTLRKHFNNPKITFGIADHIDGDLNEAIYLPSLALAFGVTSIEKHITIDRKDKLEDYEAALGIEQFKDFVSYIDVSLKALGSGAIDYLVNDSYTTYRDVVRKKLVAARDIKKGVVLSSKDVEFKRADIGEQIDSLDKMLGKKLLKDINKGQGLEMNYFL